MSQTIVNNALLATEITRLFQESKILQVDRSRHPSWPTNAMAFEDEYSVIAVWIFESVELLVAEWGAAQDLVVQLLGTSVLTTDPKSWDGYLLLAAVDGIPEELVAQISSVRSDTRRVRKLIITAEDLPSRISDPLQMTPYVRRALAPVLDLNLNPNSGRSDPLDSLHQRLPNSMSAFPHLEAVIAAYASGESPIEALHDRMTEMQEKR